MNYAMAKKLLGGKALDVRKEGIAVGDNLYKLERFVEGVDYCDAQEECWVWSIARNRQTGEIFASLSCSLYQDDEWECLFLR